MFIILSNPNFMCFITPLVNEGDTFCNLRVFMIMDTTKSTTRRQGPESFRKVGNDYEN